MLPYHGERERQIYAEAEPTQFDILKYTSKKNPNNVQKKGIWF